MSNDILVEKIIESLRIVLIVYVSVSFLLLRRFKKGHDIHTLSDNMKGLRVISAITLIFIELIWYFFFTRDLLMAAIETGRGILFLFAIFPIFLFLKNLEEDYHTSMYPFMLRNTYRVMIIFIAIETFF